MIFQVASAFAHVWLRVEVLLGEKKVSDFVVVSARDTFPNLTGEEHNKKGHLLFLSFEGRNKNLFFFQSFERCFSFSPDSAFVPYY